VHAEKQRRRNPGLIWAKFVPELSIGTVIAVPSDGTMALPIAGMNDRLWWDEVDDVDDTPPHRDQLASH
jgi:hypothetical protein